MNHAPFFFSPMSRNKHMLPPPFFFSFFLLLLFLHRISVPACVVQCRIPSFFFATGYSSTCALFLPKGMMRVMMPSLFRVPTKNTSRIKPFCFPHAYLSPQRYCSFLRRYTVAGFFSFFFPAGPTSRFFSPQVFFKMYQATHSHFLLFQI